MACDAARPGAFSLLLRRVAATRAFRRLLVLAGLLIAGWLLGCVAQSAHADEVPAAPSRVVAKTPVADAVTTVREREPVPRVVRAVVERPPREDMTRTVPPTPPDAWAEPGAEREAALAAEPVTVRKAHQRPHQHGVSNVSQTRKAVDHTSRRAVQHERAPSPGPDRPDSNTAAGTLVVNAATAGFPDAGQLVPAPPRETVSRVLGATPPAVRTAADEPSFAPD